MLNLPVVPIVIALALLSGGGSKKKKPWAPAPAPVDIDVPEPVDEDPVLCTIDLGPSILVGNMTAGELAADYFDQWAKKYAASAATPNDSLYAWAVAGAIQTVKVLGGQAESPWPLCWGAQDVAGWPRKARGAASVVRLLAQKVVLGEDVGWPLQPVAGATPAAVAQYILTITGGADGPAALSKLGQWGQGETRSLVTHPAEAIAFTLYRGAESFLEAVLES